MQQANFVLPWRWVLLLQLINFSASLSWSAFLPCWLQLHADSTTGQLDFGPIAVAACSRLQQLFMVLRLLAGDPAYHLGLDVCQSEVAAVQVLQIVASSLLLLLLPLLVLGGVELWLKRRFLRSLASEQHGEAADAEGNTAAGSSATTSSAASSSAASGRSVNDTTSSSNSSSSNNDTANSSSLHVPPPADRKSVV